MKKILLFILLGCLPLISLADLKVYLYNTKSPHKSIGYIIFKNTQYGLLIKPSLHGLSPGMHGFHIHKIGSCADGGLAAGGHYDPDKTGKHLGPYNSKGHLGDMPALYFDKKGIADHPVLSPRLTVKNLLGHAIMIHAGGDNYSDHPKKLGGGGMRAACGIVKVAKN